MEAIKIAKGVDGQAEAHRRANRSPKSSRVLQAVSLGWNTVEGIRRAVSTDSDTPSPHAIRDHLKRLRQSGLVTYNDAETLLGDIPAPDVEEVTDTPLRSVGGRGGA